MTSDRRSDDTFRNAVLAGLARRPRAIPCKYLYDDAGAALFERICRLEDYYLTRAEIALLHRHGHDIARLAGKGRIVVDLGAGSMEKTRLLLAALDSPAAYVPIDIARLPLLHHARRLAGEFPWLTVAPLEADFTGDLALPPVGPGHLLAFFPGSTIGNLRPPAACALLRRIRRMIQPGGALLIGVDLVKEAEKLERAYDDESGVTAAFTTNLLVRVNRELGADFDPAGFRHRARWNPKAGRVEIHLVSTSRQQAGFDGHRFDFRRGDAIHVEDCHKYQEADFHRLAARAGLASAATWIDSASHYSLHLLVP
jgi:dimethylhistidine N-methyltransferase